MTRDLDHLIRVPWREVRKRVTGSADKPLHASSFGQDASKEDIHAVAEFFRGQPFGRFGATVSINTALPEEISPLETVSLILKNRILALLRWTRANEVKLIFEASDRADRLVEEAFGDLRITENGTEIPVDCYFMPKASAEPALEVADFIMHAVGRQGRHVLAGRGGFVPDFRAVFHDQDPQLVSYMHAEKAERRIAPVSP